MEVVVECVNCIHAVGKVCEKYLAKGKLCNERS